MAAGRPALAFNRSRSGMGWVGQLPSLSWSQSYEGLSEALQSLADDPSLLTLVGQQARARYLENFSHQIWQQSAKKILDFSPTL